LFENVENLNITVTLKCSHKNACHFACDEAKGFLNHKHTVLSQGAALMFT